MAPQNECLDEWVGEVVSFSAYSSPGLPSEAWDDFRKCASEEPEITTGLVTLVSYDELGVVVGAVAAGPVKGTRFYPWSAVVGIMGAGPR